jgi:hypothetical protein
MAPFILAVSSSEQMKQKYGWFSLAGGKSTLHCVYTSIIRRMWLRYTYYFTKQRVDHEAKY